MRTVVDDLLTSRHVARVAAAITLLLGLVFAFIWSPHPWGWRGIDQYHQLATDLARGEPFGTTDVPWAYAYFVAGFYALFGEEPWLPVLTQVILNATVPLLVYAIVTPLADRRTAGLAALLVGVFSFNTVYASTQSSDALCTITFLCALLTLMRAYRSNQVVWYGVSGALSGVMPQFRPNLILLPIVAAVVVMVLARDRRKAVRGSVVYFALFAALLTPWTWRNYQLTNTFLPSSSHGGVQLWYGTLQTGDHLESRAHNPRSVFETPAFDYFSIPRASIIVSASPRGCAPDHPERARLVYRTDRDSALRTVERQGVADRLSFELPGQPLPTTVYYWFETTWRLPDGNQTTAYTPSGGAATPFVLTVSDDHVGDLDRHGDLVDVFDVARLVAGVAWNNSASPTLLHQTISRLLPTAGPPELHVSPDLATLRFGDGSTFSVPRDFARVTDLQISGATAAALSYARLPQWQHSDSAAASPETCLQLEDVAVNEAFYRREPHMMRRYTALALDNIARDPLAFLTASLYRAGRLFLIRGTSDQATTQQFESSRTVYLAGTVLSAVYLTLFLAGVVIALRQRSKLLVLLVPILYVPATICFVLTNMRYTITVQPLMFVFIALGVAGCAKVRRVRQGAPGAGEVLKS